MYCFTILFTATHQWLRKPLLLIILLLLLLLAGCEEDFRTTKISAERASALANSRLDKATGGLLETFNKQRPDARKQLGKSQQLTWTAPLTRADGSSLALGQIAEFRIYYRLRHERKYAVISIMNPTITHYSLERLPRGAYEFSITTVDANGLESRRSDPVTADLI